MVAMRPTPLVASRAQSRCDGVARLPFGAPPPVRSIVYTIIVYSLKSPTGGAALVYSPYYDLKLTVLYSLHDELARLVRSSTAASAVAQKIATVLYLAEAASFVYSMPPVG